MRVTVFIALGCRAAGPRATRKRKPWKISRMPFRNIWRRWLNMKDEKIMAIKKLFEEAQRIIADECKHNKTEDLLCQYEIIQTRKCESLTKEPDILNNLAVQAAS